MPRAKVTVSVYWPADVLWDCMYSMLGTPVTTSSIGTATFCATVCAPAPTYAACTVTVGGVMLGYCSRGNVTYDSAPTSTINSDIAIAKIGRWMKNWLSMAGALPQATGSRTPGRRARDARSASP